MVASELDELLDTAMYREIVSQALYLAAKKKTDDPGAIALLNELAEQEFNHSKMVKKLRDEKLYDKGWRQENISNLMISEYLTAPDIYEGAGLQDTFIFALKREEQAAQTKLRFHLGGSGMDSSHLRRP